MKKFLVKDFSELQTLSEDELSFINGGLESADESAGETNYACHLNWKCGHSISQK
nr:hypothetical protein [uncultured Prevotella sp.]